jgi:hypothetical protein
MAKILDLLEPRIVDVALDVRRGPAVFAGKKR